MGEMTDDDIQQFIYNQMNKAVDTLQAVIRKDMNEEPLTLSDGTVIKRGDSIWRVD